MHRSVRNPHANQSDSERYILPPRPDLRWNTRRGNDENGEPQDSTPSMMSMDSSVDSNEDTGSYEYVEREPEEQ